MPPKMKINGVEYELPTLDSMDLDEAILLERYSGTTLDQIQTREGNIALAAVKALAIIGILRARPDVPEADAAREVGRLKLVGLQETFDIGTDEEGKPLPPQNGDGDKNESADLPSPSGETLSDTGEASEGSDDQETSGDPPSESLPFGLKTSAV